MTAKFWTNKLEKLYRTGELKKLHSWFFDEFVKFNIVYCDGKLFTDETLSQEVTENYLACLARNDLKHRRGVHLSSTIFKDVNRLFYHALLETAEARIDGFERTGSYDPDIISD